MQEFAGVEGRAEEVGDRFEGKERDAADKGQRGEHRPADMGEGPGERHPPIYRRA